MKNRTIYNLINEKIKNIKNKYFYNCVNLVKFPNSVGIGPFSLLLKRSLFN